MKRYLGQSAAIAVMLALATAAWGADSAEKCEAIKLKLAGKYGYCRLKAESKALKNRSAPDYAKCDAQLSAGWTAAESAGGGDCPTSGDQGPRQDEITLESTRMAWRLSGADRFVDNADGTVSDRQTGLTWEKKTERDSLWNPANPHDADNQYYWSGVCANSPDRCQPNPSAATLCASNTGDAHCGECGPSAGPCSVPETIWSWAAGLNAANFAGHNDWRIPTLAELQTIVDYADATPPAADVAFQGADCGSACTDITSPLCSCTGGGAGAAWSASPYKQYTDTFWFVWFGDGRPDFFPTTAFVGVRAVRP